MGPSFGKYQLIANLGRGGMADVYLALMSGPVGFRKLVVVKRLREDVAERAALESMLLDEAKLAARLQHPNVVQTFEVGTHEGSAYLAMEYLEGQSLANLVRAGGRLPANLAAQIMADALAGLAYAHTVADYDGRPLAIVHRDVSPQNLFVTYGGEVKVVDFGVAKTALGVPVETQAGVLKGKLGYMAPEQVHGEPVDARTDVYASGIVLWELLTGTRLFRPGPGDGPTQAIAKMLYAPVARPSELVPDLPLPLEAICMRALERDAARRWPTAAAMREALYSFLESSGGPPRREAIGQHVTALFADVRDAMKKQITAAIAEAENATHLVPAAELEALGVTRSEVPSRAPSAPPRVPSAPPPPRAATERLPAGAALPGLPGPPFAAGGSSAAVPVYPGGPPLLSSAAVPVVGPAPVLASVPVGVVPDAALGAVPAPAVRAAPSRSRWPLLVAGAVVAFGLTTLLLRQRPHGAGPSVPVDAAPSATVTARPAPLLVLEGSGTIGVDAAPRFVEGFFARRGSTVVRRERGERPEDLLVVAQTPAGAEESILVRNGGTKDGFACLASRSCDLAMAAREIREPELAALAAQGIADPRATASEHVIGLDGIPVIVHPSNPLSSLDRDRLGEVFSGATADWRGVIETSAASAAGGARSPIDLVVHEEGSGTLDVFDEIVLRGRPIAPGAKRLPTNAAIASAVTLDPSSIGFVGLAFVHGAKALALHDRGLAPMLPTPFTVTTERYLLTRRFYLYTPSPPKPLALELVEHVLSDAGQQAIRAAGFVDLGVAFQSTEPCDHCPARYAKATRGARRIAVDFRFRGASATLDARARRDVDRVVRFLREHAASRVLLFGFVDGTGDAKSDQRRSRELAQAVDAELQTRGVHATTVEGLGAEMPLAATTTEWGRSKNRRVEIWAFEDR